VSDENRKQNGEKTMITSRQGTPDTVQVLNSVVVVVPVLFASHFVIFK
jgi:hypothetical protein